MKSRYQSGYERSPLWLQDVLISGYGAKLLGQRYRRDYFAQRERLRTRNDQDRKLLEVKQLRQMREFLSFAQTHSRFYQDRWSDVDISRLQSVGDLQRLPFTTKEDLRANIQNVYTIDPSRAITAFTGGTTGASLEVRYTSTDFQYRMAYLDAFKERVGVDVFRSKKATFSGRQFTASTQASRRRFWRTNLPFRQRLYSTFDLTNENLPLYIADLNSYKPDVVNGFVSAIYDVAQFVARNNIELTFAPQAVFTTSETLLPFHRALIESTFKTRVYNQYASAEGAPFVTECVHGSLHFDTDTGVIEVDHDEPAAGALVTSFTTHGTPLIRYAIGDEFVFSEQGSCDCGSAFPIIDRIEGRSVDFLGSPDGRKVSLSHLADVIKGLPNNVIAMQFVQRRSDRIEVRMVVDRSSYTDRHEASILEELRYRFSPIVEFDFQYVDEIGREPSGKIALIKNSLEEES